MVNGFDMEILENRCSKLARGLSSVRRQKLSVIITTWARLVGISLFLQLTSSLVLAMKSALMGMKNYTAGLVIIRTCSFGNHIVSNHFAWRTHKQSIRRGLLKLLCYKYSISSRIRCNRTQSYTFIMMNDNEWGWKIDWKKLTENKTRETFVKLSGDQK